MTVKIYYKIISVFLFLDLSLSLSLYNKTFVLVMNLVRVMELSLHIINRCNYELSNCSAKVHSRGFQRLVQFARLDAQITPISSNGENNNNCRASHAKSTFLILSFSIVGFLFSLTIRHFPILHERILFLTLLYDRGRFTLRETCYFYMDRSLVFLSCFSLYRAKDIALLLLFL